MILPSAAGVVHYIKACRRKFTPDSCAAIAVVGSLLARNWWLPEEICQAIRHHHEQPAIDLAGPPLTSRRLIAVSQSAEHLLQSITGGSRTQEWPKLGGACRRVLGVDERILLELHAGAALLLDAIV